jgi:hypothetical protein
MIRCPECNTRSQNTATYCDSCLYKFTNADHAAATYRTRRLKYRLAAVAVGLGVAALRYAFLG